jgi:hypothetical protein
MIFNDLKNLTPIYSSKYGRGLIVSVTWRRSDQLFMCYFYSLKEHTFMTSFEFAHNESLSFEPFKIKEEDLKKNVIKKEKPAYD